MSFWKSAGSIGRGGSRTIGRGLGFWTKWGITGIILGIILINSIVITTQTKDLGEGIDYLGEKFLNPLLKLQQESIRIYESNGLSSEDGERPGFFQIIKIYWNFISSVYIIILWVVLLQKFYNAILGGNIPTIVKYVFAFITFSIVQLFYLQYTNMPINTVWNAYGDIWRATPYLFNRVVDFSDKFIGGEDLINETMNNTLNSI